MIVPAGADGMRLDAFVASALGVSRAVAAELAKAGIRVDGVGQSRSTRLRSGQVVDLPAAPVAPRLAPDPGGLTVVYEDAEVIVIDKPAGLVVHPGGGVKRGTVAGRLLAMYPELEDVGDPGRPGIVHRLDRDTSGLMCIARTNEALASLRDAMRRREIRREYLALVLGTPAATSGTIDAPIGVDPARRSRRAVRSDGRPARTHYEVRERWTRPDLALLSVTLETGRTHQIRVHLAAIGLPVAGDATYGRGAAGIVPGLSRPFLHAVRLVIPGKEPIESPLPPELSTVISLLGHGQL